LGYKPECDRRTDEKANGQSAMRNAASYKVAQVSKYVNILLQS